MCSTTSVCRHPCCCGPPVQGWIRRRRTTSASRHGAPAVGLIDERERSAGWGSDSSSALVTPGAVSDRIAALNLRPGVADLRHRSIRGPATHAAGVVGSRSAHLLLGAPVPDNRAPGHGDDHLDLMRNTCRRGVSARTRRHGYPCWGQGPATSRQVAISWLGTTDIEAMAHAHGSRFGHSMLGIPPPVIEWCAAVLRA